MGRAEMPPIFKEGQLRQAKDQVTGLNAQLDKTRESLGFIAGSFTDAVNELSKGNKFLSNAKSSLNSLAGIANTLKVEAQDLNNLSEKRLLGLEKRAKVQFETLKNSKANLDVNSAAYKEAQNALKSEKEFLETVKQIRAEKEAINKDKGVSVFGGLEGLTSAIPGLKKLTPAFKEASDAAKEQAAFNMKNFGNTKGVTKQMKAQNVLARAKRAENLKALRSGKGLNAAKVKELGLEKMLMSKSGKGVTGAAGAKMLKGKDISKLAGAAPAKLAKSMTPFMKGLKALAPALKGLAKSLGPIALLLDVLALDKQTADMAKNTNITYKEARKVRAELSGVANRAGDFADTMGQAQNFITGAKLVETFNSINSSLGTSATTMDSEMLVSLTEMREMAGFTNEELQGIAAITLATGKSVDDITGEFMAQAKLGAMQNGVLINEKELLKGIKDVSAATTLSFGQNPKLIGEAVGKAKSLGMEMSKVEGIAGSLLDFESSIEAELSAELLLGKNINLEKARQAALNNDLATVAEEIAKQAGTAAEFGEMNRIQQEALARAVGMGREELASTLFLQEQLKGLTGEAAKEAESDFARRVEVLGLAGAQRELEEKGVDGLRNQVGMADRMLALMDKLNEAFVGIVEPLMPLLDVFVAIMGIVGKLIKALDPLLQTLSVLGNLIGDTLGGFFTDEPTDYSATMEAFDRQGKSMEAYGYDNPNNPTKMAKGGIVTGPTRAIVGEAGPEAVIPLSGNTPAIKVDNSETNNLLRVIADKLTTVDMYEIQ